MTNHAPILALDVDGVIIDSFPKKRWNETLEADFGIDPAQMSERFFMPHWNAIIKGKKPIVPALTAFLEDYGTKVTTEEFIAYWHRNHTNLRHEVIEAALIWKECTGGRLALATNQDQTRAKYLEKDLGLSKDFDVIVASCNIGFAKPEPEYFQKADRVLERAPSQTVIFLDDIENNVAGAKRHGWKAHHVQSFSHAVEMIENLNR
jgi:putative hydrolase of the HAD superfamily